VRLTVGLAQIRCEKGDWEGNLARAEEYMRRATDAACDVIVFPEAGLSGYCDYRRFPAAAKPLDSPFVRAFVALTARYPVVASGGFLEPCPTDPRPYVTQVLAAGGRLLGVYRKVNIVDEDADAFSAGSETPVFALPVGGQTVTCALSVCSDSDRPALFSAFARQGARVVFHSAAPGLYDRPTSPEGWQAGFDWYRGHLQTHLSPAARDNGLTIAVATQTGSTGDEDFPGYSCVFGPDGRVLAATSGCEETLLVATLPGFDNTSLRGV
jgi:predicted amidohydrolase